jgi:hypothetical protein
VDSGKDFVALIRLEYRGIARFSGEFAEFLWLSVETRSTAAQAVGTYNDRTSVHEARHELLHRGAYKGIVEATGKQAREVEAEASAQ